MTPEQLDAAAAALDPDAPDTPGKLDGLSAMAEAVEHREGMTPIVRCLHCGRTTWHVSETSFVYQRATIDTEEDEPDGDGYDSGDIEATWARSVEFATCVCGREPTPDQAIALAVAWNVENCYQPRIAAILTAAGKVARMGTGPLSPTAKYVGELDDAIADILLDWPEGEARQRASERDLGDLLPG